MINDFVKMPKSAILGQTVYGIKSESTSIEEFEIKSIIDTYDQDGKAVRYYSPETYRETICEIYDSADIYKTKEEAIAILNENLN